MHDITGMRFGRLVAIRYAYSVNHRRFWECACDCGSLCEIRQDQLITGKTRSCGCISREIKAATAKEAQERKAIIAEQKAFKRSNHLLKADNPRLYRIWKAMKSRCYYPKNKCFNSYGARGISICEEWKSSFAAFARWALANGYLGNLTIDRIDVDGNYCPENCRWITMQEQQKNKRKTPPIATGDVKRGAVTVCETGDGSGTNDMITHRENNIPAQICQAEAAYG